MTLQNNVMKMRHISSLALPADKTVALKLGGFHLMLSGLKQPFSEGYVLPVTLVIEGKDRQRKSDELKVPVRAINGAPAGGQLQRNEHEIPTARVIRGIVRDGFTRPNPRSTDPRMPDHRK